MNVTRLVAINGVSIEEIYEHWRPIFPMVDGFETSFRARGWNPFIFRSMLQYAGVIGDEEVVPITFRDVNGNEFIVESFFVEEMADVELVAHEVDHEGLIYTARQAENYYFRYFENDSMMYFRIWRAFEMPDRPSSEFVQGLKNEIVRLGGVRSFVIDSRINVGGSTLEGFNDLIIWAMDESNRRLLGDIYVIVDHMSFSAGVVHPLMWQHFVEDVIVIGEPTAGTLNGFGSILTQTMPNSQISFATSFSHIRLAGEGQPNSPLVPDIIVHRTLNDYLNNHDAVISAIRERSE
ncbi:MAG: hypothetical protein LBE35_09995 [Clostridiales bacterium]|nr:hypothetical protein [Clostridiales bacterium]